MANVTRDTYSELKHYVSVRLQQGVPMVDADWNEQSDLKRYELNAFLKWFVGDGVPAGNDGFRILPVKDRVILSSNRAEFGKSSVQVILEDSTAKKILGFEPTNSMAERMAPPAAQLTGTMVGPFEGLNGKTLTIRADDSDPVAVVFSDETTALEVSDRINEVADASGLNLTASVGAANDFDIKGGDGVVEAPGRCLVEGWNAANECHLKYSSQALFINSDLAAAWEVEVLPPLPQPAAGDEIAGIAYLDVWEREVGPGEDPELINDLIGEETCVRLKREWVVRIALNPEIPAPTKGHVHYALANLKWVGQELSIEDLRLTGIAVGSYNDVQQTTLDSFGETYTLDHDGQPNLEISLRDAINAILRGGLPQPEAQFLIRRAYLASVVKDNEGGIWVFWMTELGDGYQLRYSRYKLLNGKLNEVAQDQVTDKIHWGFSSGEDDEYDPSPNVPFAVADRAGGVLVLWPSISTGEEALWWRYHDGSTWMDDGRPVPAPSTPSGASNGFPFAFEGSDGAIWLFWVTAYVVEEDASQSEVKIAWNRFQNQAWGGPNFVPITDTDKFPLPQDDERPGAYEDRDGNIHLFWAAEHRLMTHTYEMADGDWSSAGPSDVPLLLEKDERIEDIVATKDRQGIPTLVYSVKEQFEGNRVRNIGYAQRNESNGSWLIGYITQTHVEESEPFPVFHSDGKIYVFWHVATEDVVNIWYKRTRNAWTSVNSNWEDAALLPGLPEHNGLPMAIEDETGNIWIFFADVDVFQHGPDWADIDHWHIGMNKLLMAI